MFSASPDNHRRFIIPSGSISSYLLSYKEEQTHVCFHLRLLSWSLTIWPGASAAVHQSELQRVWILKLRLLMGLRPRWLYVSRT